MSKLEYCPQCVIELQQVKKKLGSCTNFLKCPVCGFLKRPDGECAGRSGAFIDRLRKNNKNITQFNIELEY